MIQTTRSECETLLCPHERHAVLSACNICSRVVERRSVNTQNSVLLFSLVLEVTSHAVPRDIVHQLRTGLGFMHTTQLHWMVCVSDLVDHAHVFYRLATKIVYCASHSCCSSFSRFQKLKPANQTTGDMSSDKVTEGTKVYVRDLSCSEDNPSLHMR